MSRVARADVEKFQNELNSVIHRWSEESDITVSEMLGSLDIVKQEWLLRVYTPGIQQIVRDEIES